MLSFCAGPEARWVRISRGPFAHSGPRATATHRARTALSSTHAPQRGPRIPRASSRAARRPSLQRLAPFRVDVGRLARRNRVRRVARARTLAGRARRDPNLFPHREPRRVLRSPWPDAPPSQGALAILFERHTQQHHRYYTHEAMAADSPRDFQMVLFPPVMLIFFLGFLATPIGLVIGYLGTPNLGWLFAATAISYFLTYEWLHWSYHQPESVVDRAQSDRAQAAPPSHDPSRPRADDERELQHHVPDRRPHLRYELTRSVVNEKFTSTAPPTSRSDTKSPCPTASAQSPSAYRSRCRRDAGCRSGCTRDRRCPSRCRRARRSP